MAVTVCALWTLDLPVYIQHGVRKEEYHFDESLFGRSSIAWYFARTGYGKLNPGVRKKLDFYISHTLSLRLEIVARMVLIEGTFDLLPNSLMILQFLLYLLRKSEILFISSTQTTFISLVGIRWH